MATYFTAWPLNPLKGTLVSAEGGIKFMRSYAFRTLRCLVLNKKKTTIRQIYADGRF